jgi:tRNA A-37 threonylcarbamoyl transferase component Bud32
MHSSSTDPFHGLDPAGLMAAAAMPTDGDADTLPLKRADLPTLEEIATAFPDLEILGLIGHGGMSAVFKTRQPKLDRVVALKVLPKSLAATPGFAERFNREGRVLARLSHPSIVAVHDFGESGGFAYLTMEFVDGVNLRQAMRAGRFTPEQALKIIPAICDALQFAHTQGVLHRDIKPENILLDTAGRVKIADFGIAKILNEKGGDMLLTQSGAKLGTAPYMAPEQIEQPSSVDHRADIYSLGVVFYEMLTGELPLGRFAAPSELSSVGGNIDEIVFRALEKERTRRQQSVDEFKTQVEGAGPLPRRGRRLRRGDPFEYQSKRRLCGMPLLHVVSGRDPVTGETREAHGFFAIGDRARGVFAFGGIAKGWFAFGGVAIGLVAFGGIGLGLISFSGLAVGLLLSYGGLSIGALAVGGLAVGYHAVGGIVLGWHGMGAIVFAHQGCGDNVHAVEVVKNMQLMPRLTLAITSSYSWSAVLSVVWLPVSAFMWCAYAWGYEQADIAAGEKPEHPMSVKMFWLVPAVTAVCAVIGWLVYALATSTVALSSWMLIPGAITACGLLMFIAGVPLWLCFVPVNSFYGVRLASTMNSDERWYEVNAMAGKKLVKWSVSILIAGIAGFYQLPRHQDDYPWAALALTQVAIAAVLVSVWSWLRHHPVNGPVTKPSWLTKAAGNVVIGLVVAYFIKSFIMGAYRVPQGNEPGVAKNSHWLASHLDTGFAAGDLILFEHDSGHIWIARVEKRERDGLLLKRGGKPESFFVKWDKVIGKMLFSHFTPDALTPVQSMTEQASAKIDVETLEGTRQWDELRSPELRYLQLKRRGDKTWQDKVYDTQGRQVQDAQALRQVKESFPDLIHTTDPAHADECMVLLWFEHADFDGRSLLEINLLDESGKPLRLAHGRPGSAPLSTKQPPLRSCSLVLGSKEQLPRHITVELGFSTGPWELSNKVSPQFQGEEMLKGVAGFVTATGNDKEGRAFVSWHNENLFTKQVGCYAILKSGRKIGHWEGSAHGSMVDARLEKYRAPGSREVARLESVNFQVPLSEVEAFQIRHRLLRWEIYKQIVVPPLE